jgi:hypothetical protein
LVKRALFLFFEGFLRQDKEENKIGTVFSVGIIAGQFALNLQ